MMPPAVTGPTKVKQVKSILVIGAGQIAKSIAYALTYNPDLTVIMYSSEAQDLSSGIRSLSQHVLERRVTTKAELEDRLSRIIFTPVLEYITVESPDLIIEADSENKDRKRQLFSKLEVLYSRDTIFCSNTSSIRPSDISEKLTYRERFVGLHFLTPANINPLVEVIKTDATTDKTVGVVMNLLKSVEKIPILCQRDVQGFVLQRLQDAMRVEARSIIKNGIADEKAVVELIKYLYSLGI